MEDIRVFVKEDLFRKNARRRSFCFRLFSPTRRDYQPYELTLMRVNTGDEHRRIITVIWHRIGKAGGSQHIPVRSSPHAAPALYGLVSSALRCRNDGELTIDAGSHTIHCACLNNSSTNHRLTGSVNDFTGNDPLLCISRNGDRQEH
jgi:hypothetical protein